MSYKECRVVQLSSSTIALKSHFRIGFLKLFRDGRILISPGSLFPNLGPKQIISYGFPKKKMRCRVKRRQNKHSLKIAKEMFRRTLSSRNANFVKSLNSPELVAQVINDYFRARGCGLGNYGHPFSIDHPFFY